MNGLQDRHRPRPGRAPSEAEPELKQRGHDHGMRRWLEDDNLIYLTEPPPRCQVRRAVAAISGTVLYVFSDGSFLFALHISVKGEGTKPARTVRAPLVAFSASFVLVLVEDEYS